MNWKIISSILLMLVFFNIPAAAQVTNSISTQSSGSSTSISTQSGDSSTSASVQSSGSSSSYTTATNEVTVHTGDTFTLVLGESTPPYKYIVISSNGLKLQSSTPQSKTFIAIDKGQQKITVEYRKPTDNKPIQTVTNILDVI